ncbi:MAG: alpha/beta hydrolase [Planctomycetes bacterium]|nr:alpha/beta hydrolase [Planctomycetota bacterium]
MLVELVRTKTSDGLRLDGALAFPQERRMALPSVDGVILLHGVGGNYFSGAMFDPLAIRLLDAGIAVLRVNTRGYGSVNMIATDGGATRGGAAFEVVDQCRYDINAWCDFLVVRGLSRIGLIGHSLGAIKAVYSAAHAPHADVASVIAASPPRLSYSAFQHGPRSHDFFESLSTAKQLVKEGRPEQLITAKFPFPLLISAASYVDKYGDERYNILKFVSQVGCPTLFTYGSIELEQGGIAFAGLPEAIHQATSDAPEIQRAGIKVATIAGADHFYSGKFDELAEVVVSRLLEE